MNKILVVGNLFHNLKNEIEKRNINYTLVAINDVNNIKKMNEYDAIICIGVNILLNSSKFHLIKNIFENSSPKTNIHLWTHEPFWHYGMNKVEYFFGKKVYIYNCYNNLVFTSIFSHYFGVGGILWRNRVKQIDIPSDKFLKQKFNRVKNAVNKPVCAYATCFHDFRLDVPKSISRLRNTVIKDFYDYGICDVYGRNWKGKWQLEITNESRAGSDAMSWGAIKVEESSEKYLFSICLENSLINNYVTEKFAQAIESYLIPIYVLGNGLEDFFDREYILELNLDGSNIDELISQVNTMDFEEYRLRILYLVQRYNEIISNISLINLERNKPAKILMNSVDDDLSNLK